MKQIQLLISLLLIFMLSDAQQAKQDFGGFKIFIDPGHGGHDANDRHIEATDFWESDGNLIKSLYLRDLLKKLNATIYMSRTANSTADELSLSAIVAMANTANADFLLSVHSNGFDGTLNHPLTLYRGYTDQPVYTESRVLAKIMWQTLLDNGNCWTRTNEWVYGDFTFYPAWNPPGLGVFRGLNMPGVLSEGSFHDYIPESWRMRNKDFLHRESWALARSFIEYFNVKPLNYGIIAGVIRDQTKSPTWYFAPGTKDEALPLNGGTVTLKPGNLVYKIDSLNNGFFMFDSIAPGNYKLYFEGVKNYMKDSLAIAVIANKTNFADKFLQYDTTTIPKLISVLPLISDSIALNQEFTFKFDMAMDTGAVQKALNINPSVKLVYTWMEKNTTLKVKPETLYLAKTNYTLTLSTTACSKWKYKIASPFEMKFVTKNRSALKLEKYYPALNQENISLYPQFRLFFDAPVNQINAKTNIQILDDANVSLTKKNEEFMVKEGKGYYFFDLTDPLKINKSYRIVLNANLSDETGIKLGKTTEITFTTHKTPTEIGQVIESFDDISRFWDPENSGSTVGTNGPLTTFTASSSVKMGGSSSGKLNYVFINTSGGVCRVFNTVKPSVGQDMSKKFGMWVYGDLSLNTLGYWFYSSDGSNQIVVVDTIDWAGWDFKTIPMSKIGGGGDRTFQSVVITQTSTGSKEGTIYFDEAQLFYPLAINNNYVTNQMHKANNYPNPFSCKNTISLNLTQRTRIKIEVFNILGQTVDRLFEGYGEAGQFTVDWMPPAQLMNGIYLYRIELNNGVNNKTDIIYSKCVLNR